MMKLMFIYSMAVILVGCHEPFLSRNYATWYIKNCTDHTIKIANGHVADSIINSGDSAIIDRVSLESEPYFEHLFSKWGNSPKQTWHVNVLSDEEVLLRTWMYSERDNSGKQFFKLDSWCVYEHRISGKYSNSGKYSELNCKWVFEISSKDIDSH